MKTKLILLLLASIVSLSSAECNGTVDMLDIPNQPIMSGEVARIIIVLENISQEEIRNLDVRITDPMLNTVFSREYRIGNTTNIILHSMRITSDYIAGNYTIFANFYLLNSSNDDMKCAFFLNRTIYVETDRKTYTDIDIDVKIDKEYQSQNNSWNTSITRNISIHGVVFPVKIYLRNLPITSNVVVSDETPAGDVPLPSIDISAGLPFLSKILPTCQENETRISQMCSNISETYIESCFRSASKVDEIVGVYQQEFKDNLDYVIANQTREISELKLKNQKVDITNINFITGFVIATIGSLFIIYRMGKEPDRKLK